MLQDKVCKYRKTASRGVSASQSEGIQRCFTGFNTKARAHASSLSGLSSERLPPKPKKAPLDPFLIHAFYFPTPLPSQYYPHPPFTAQTMAVTAQLFLAQQPTKNA
jgi:hypothetical protein